MSARSFAIALIVAVASGVPAFAPASSGAAAGEHTALQPPALLSETGLYSDIATRRIADGNLPFDPQYPLWTDGAAKSRWIHIPKSAAIDARDTDRWRFPVGTKVWKQFAFDGRIVETRFLWRATADQWVFATYVWNDEQTDAVLAPSAGMRNYYRIADGVMYSIPSDAECHACHSSSDSPILGFTALQLSDDRDPLAPHANRLREDSMTIRRLNDLGLLRPARKDLEQNPPRIRARSPRERAALGYFVGNCASCHNAEGPVAALGLELQHDERHANEPAILTAVDVAGTYVTPGATSETSRRIAPGSPETSAIVYRMSSRRPMSQMPPLGTAIVDVEALDLIRAWIAEDLPRDAQPSPASEASR